MEKGKVKKERTEKRGKDKVGEDGTGKWKKEMEEGIWTDDSRNSNTF